MKKFLAILLAILGGLLVVVLIAMNVISRREAQAFVHITTAERQQRRVDEADLRQTPEEYGADLRRRDRDVGRRPVAGWLVCTGQQRRRGHAAPRL